MRIGWLVLVSYAAWLGASLMTQHHTPRLQRLVQRLDPLRLCPAWYLFRSPPLRAAVSWRDQLKDGTCTPWRAESMAPAPTWLAPLWRPQAYRPQLLYTCVAGTIGAAQSTSGASPLEDSFPYRVLWHYIAHLPGTPETVTREFQLLVSDDGASPPSRVVYRSPLLPLPRGAHMRNPAATM